MRHRATRRFWQAYHALPQPARAIADKNFQLLKADLRHPSLHFKRIGRTYSVRVGLDYRALALVRGDEAVWFWIGTHADYDDITLICPQPTAHSSTSTRPLDGKAISTQIHDQRLVAIERIGRIARIAQRLEAHRARVEHH